MSEQPAPPPADLPANEPAAGRRRWPRRVVVILLQLIAIGAIAGMISQLTWADRVSLGDQSLHGTITNDRAEWDAAGIQMRLSDGTARVIPIEQVAVTEKGVPQVEIGLESLFSTLPISLALLALLCIGGSLSLMSFRWWLLARKTGVNLSYYDALRLMAVGFFYSFAPGGAATGDVLKAMVLKLRTTKASTAFVSVFADRGLGLATMVGIGIGAMLLFGGGVVQSGGSLRTITIAIGVILAVLIAGGAIALSPGIRKRLPLMRWLATKSPAAPIVQKIDAALLPYSNAKLSFAAAAVVSATAQTLQCILAWQFGEALGLPIETWHYFAVVPVSAVIGAIPALPGGLGLMEAGYVGYLALVLSPLWLPAAFALSVLMRLSLLLMAVAGFWWSLSVPRDFRVPLPNANEAEPLMDPAPQPADAASESGATSPPSAAAHA